MKRNSYTEQTFDFPLYNLLLQCYNEPQRKPSGSMLWIILS